jgi:hypothetical protein
MAQKQSEQPYPLLGCYLCGTNTQVKNNDPFLLQVLPGGRSYNYCTYHLKILKKYAPLLVIDKHRRNFIATTNEQKTYTRQYSLKRIIEELKFHVERLKD